MRNLFCFITIIAGILLSNMACHKPPADLNVDSRHATRVIQGMTSIMIHDNTNPPLAARFFSYACLAGYEVVVQNNPSLKSMYGIINGYPSIKKPAIQEYLYPAAALFAMMEVAKKMQPSGGQLDSLQRALFDYFELHGMERKMLDSSFQYAKIIAAEILAYAKADGYRQISNFPRYSPKAGKEYWFPTPPSYMSPVEPYFNKVRPFYLDSAAQLPPPPPIVFSESKSADFFKLMQDVYSESQSTDKLHKEIAAFWDCNPFAVMDKGHLQFGVKKISPGAHWMGIAGIAAEQRSLSFDSTMQVYAVLSTTLMDAFLSCWDEKYRSNRIRPETVIRRYIDNSWQPLLQTPPFPEYPSGHSVISTASAVILNSYFGDAFAYTDTVERSYGLPDRDFTSFGQAAEEAAISRFYGGIHFMDAIQEGQKAGNAVGELVLKKLSGNL